MPGQDQTGPAGQGPMTGRGAGICATGQVNNVGPGFGFGRGRGFGRGMGRGFGYRAATPAPLTREEQLESLKAQAAGLELQFKALTEQIGKLESE
ncbi:MAG: DUF5320 domain-containing protein [Verrucomicrobia bacterium]|nr:DUF5320 domain-containing protein [Verrucomicrobiota bacterium]